MRKVSIRIQIMLWYALLTTVLLALSLPVLYGAMAGSLRRDREAYLRSAAGQLASHIEWEAGDLRLLIIAQLLALTRGDAGKYHLEQLEDAILSGELPAGQRIPAIRSLAAAFRVNPATVRRALRLLLKERLISLRYRHFSMTRDVRLIGRCREKKARALAMQLRESLSALGYGRRELLDELLSAGAAE